jgi:tRNA threonylcarbamoyladenosine biosynthesis protein TsaE
METLEIFLPDVDSTRALGLLIGRSVKERLLVYLIGPLGAGKTTLVQAVGEGLGVEEVITSPTFTMLNEYHSGRLPLYHMDLYRVNDEPGAAKTLDLLQAEMDEFLHAPGVTLIEWAEPIKQQLPMEHLNIEISYTQPDASESSPGRRVVISAAGESACELLSHLRLPKAVGLAAP